LQILSGIFEKFKEKKLNVVTSLREASDSAYLTVRGEGKRREGGGGGDEQKSLGE
jgi:hypothetical protein